MAVSSFTCKCSSCAKVQRLCQVSFIFHYYVRTDRNVGSDFNFVFYSESGVRYGNVRSHSMWFIMFFHVEHLNRVWTLANKLGIRNVKKSYKLYAFRRTKRSNLIVVLVVVCCDSWCNVLSFEQAAEKWVQEVFGRVGNNTKKTYKCIQKKLSTICVFRTSSQESGIHMSRKVCTKNYK